MCAFAENSRFRLACEALLFKDIAAAAAKEIESRLWNVHVKINNKFRSRLANFRDGERKRRPVERRKVEKRYLDFIKSSMKFYRGYIQRLASHFRTAKEVLDLAQKLHLDSELVILSRKSPLIAVQHLRSMTVLSLLCGRGKPSSTHAMQLSCVLEICLVTAKPNFRKSNVIGGPQ